MLEKVYVPPIKIQGIKTKLVKLISESVCLEEGGVWFEPFMGSGVVGLNLAPRCDVFADINPYVINLYNAIKKGEINSYIVREYLEREGIYAKWNEEYYVSINNMRSIM